jgi:glycosyltransferase involved in cell wall biosynthesis
MTSKPIRYLVITPVRDEEDYIEHTISSMLAQTVLPVQWVIIDDGSKDRTGDIIDRYAAQYPWIKTVHRKDRGFRKNGGGVVEAFYDGFKAKAVEDWDYIVKLDGDLSFDKNYFEACFKYFENEPRLGIGGGSICNLVEGKAVLEGCPPFHVRGATKIYRKDTWDQIGGIQLLTGWDTIDELKANMLGWSTASFPDLLLTQHKTTGSADGGWKNCVKNGRANFNTGYHPLFMFIKCIKRLAQKPYLTGGVGLLYGYFGAYFGGIKPINDPDFIKYVRKEQMNRLLFRQSLWKY